MKNLMKLVLTVIVLATSIGANAQTTESKPMIESTVYLGYIPHMVLDVTSLGFHAGYNVTFSSQRKLVGEAQLSYSIGLFNESSDFFTQGKGNYQVLNALVGGRYYFFNRENRNSNFYVNTLIGGSFISEKEEKNENFRASKGYEIGYSIGLYRAMKNNISFGIAAETGFAVTLKVGYNF